MSRFQSQQFIAVSKGSFWNNVHEDGSKDKNDSWKKSIFDKVSYALVTIEIMEDYGNYVPKAKEAPTYSQ